MHSRKKLSISQTSHEAPLQTKALIGFRTYFREHQICPSYDDLAAILGSTKWDARQALERLEKRGLIARTPARYRPFKMTPKGNRAAAAIDRGEVLEVSSLG